MGVDGEWECVGGYVREEDVEGARGFGMGNLGGGVHDEEQIICACDTIIEEDT